MATPLVTRIRVVAAKHETTVGTPISLSGSDATFIAMNPVFQPDIEYEDREGEGSFSPFAGTLGGYGGTITFWCEVVGGGTVPSWASTLLPACGLKNTSGVFTPDSRPPEASSSGTKTVTIGFYENGVYKQLHGCMGNAVFIFESGKKMRVEFTFKGVFTSPSGVAILTPTYSSTSPLRFSGAGLTVGSVSPKIRTLRVDLGNEVILREDQDVSPQALHSALIVKRRVNGSFDPEARLVADDDPHARWLAGTNAALAFSVGSSGNRVALSLPKLQLINVQEAVASNGLQTHEQSFICNRSASAGEDEFSLTLD